MPTISGWIFSAKGYVQPGYPPGYIKSLWKAGGQQQYFTVQGWNGTVATGTKIFEGTGFPRKGSFSVPMELVIQEFEIEGWGAPTVGLTP